jgi:two-component system response regulator MprA
MAFESQESSKKKILVIGNDRETQVSLKGCLIEQAQAYEIFEARDDKQALSFMQKKPIDLILLDQASAQTDQCATCHNLRNAVGDTLPILFLSPKGNVVEIAAVLDSGADCYIPKPFELAELLAHIRAALRRSSANLQSTERIAATQKIEVGNLVIETNTRQVWRSDRHIELTKHEYDLLELLASHTGQILPTEIIFQRIWGYNHEVGLDVVKVCIYSLRKKLNEYNQNDLIHVKRGIGYMFKT